MNKHPEPLFQKRTFSPPGRINFANIFITPPKTFQFDLGVAGKEILTLSALYRSCQFLPLSDRTNTRLHSMQPMPEISSGHLANYSSIHSKYWCISGVEFTWNAPLVWYMVEMIEYYLSH